jgi:hypothetical protein
MYEWKQKSYIVVRIMAYDGKRRRKMGKVKREEEGETEKTKKKGKSTGRLGKIVIQSRTVCK